MAVETPHITVRTGFSASFFTFLCVLSSGLFCPVPNLIGQFRTFLSLNNSGGAEPFQLARTGQSVQSPETLVLDVQHEVEAGQGGDNLAVLLVQVLESGIIVEDVHPLPLVEDDPDRAVLEDQARFPLGKDAHLLIHADKLFAPGAEGLGGLDQEIQQRRMAHQAVDLVHGDDARLLVDKRVAADSAQDLGIGEGQHDRVFAHLVEGEDARPDPLPPGARQIHVGLPVQKARPGAAPAAQCGDLVGQVAGDDLDVFLVAQAREHVADQVAGRRQVGCDVVQVGKAPVQDVQRLAQQAALQVLALPTRERAAQDRFVEAGRVADLLDTRRDDALPNIEVRSIGKIVGQQVEVEARR
jgi:hypothetical protein